MTDVYTKCPGLECTSKVKISGGKYINFCCVPCWGHSWENTRGAWGIEGVEGPAVLEHSGQCAARQLARLALPVVEDDPDWIPVEFVCMSGGV